MPVPPMHAWIDGADQSTAALETALENRLPPAMIEAANDLALRSRAEHNFTNRTGTLHTNILPSQTKGSLRAGSLSVETRGETPYGSFLEDGTPAIGRKRGDPRHFAFLEPVWRRGGEAQFGAAMEAAVLGALLDAGWEVMP